MKYSAKHLFMSAALILVLTGCGSTTSNHSMSGMDHSKAQKPSTAAGTPAMGGGTYVDQVIAQSALSAELFDSTGKKFTLDSLKGKYVVIANFLTSCQEICPMTSANIRDIGDAIAKSGLSEKAIAMVLSVDGSRDVASRISAYKELYGSKNWVVASGPQSSLNVIWKYFGAPAKKEVFSAQDSKEMPMDWQTGMPNSYDMVHADLVVIIDDQGHWRWLDLGSPKVSSEIPAKMKAFLSTQGITNLNKPEEPTWSTAAVKSALSELLGKKI